METSNTGRRNRMFALGDQRFNSLLERNGGHHSIAEIEIPLLLPRLASEFTLGRTIVLVLQMLGVGT